MIYKDGLLKPSIKETWMWAGSDENLNRVKKKYKTEYKKNKILKVKHSLLKLWKDFKELKEIQIRSKIVFEKLKEREKYI